MPTTTPLHHIDPASLPVGEVLSINAGDLILNAVAGPGSGPHVTTVDGHAAILCDAPAAFMTNTAGETTISSNVAVAALVARLGPTGAFPWDHSGPLALRDSPSRADVFGVSLPVTTDEDLHAWVLWSDGDTTALIRDGSIIATGGAPAVPTSGYSYLRSTSGATVFRAAIWAEPMTLTAAQELSEDLLAEYQPVEATLTAAGTWSVNGAGAVAESDPWEPPTIPPATSGGSRVPPVPPEPQDPPDGVPAPTVRRVSELMPAPVLDSRGNPVNWEPTTVITESVGVFQVVVEGVDITYWQGAPIPVPSWTRTEPFGSAAATISVPQITPFHQLPAWCIPGASVDIRLVRPDGQVRSRFAGVVDTFGHKADAGVFTVECTGVVYVDDWQLRQPAFLTQPADVGWVIADTLNNAVSRRHDEMPVVGTGCLTSVLGGWEPKVTGWIQGLLATAVTGGRQWTVRCDERSPVLVQKDTDTVSWTVSNGQRGVDVSLTQDWSSASNVIYGEGVGPDGGRYRNAMYPNWRPDNTPPYPNGNPSKTIKVGTTDAGTDTGSGVSDWQRKVGLPATGRFTQTDKARAREVQRAAGISVDGIVGPQTWAATFGTGSNTGTLECFYMPMAYSPAVMPRSYGPDGADLGPNPAYNPDVLRVEDKVDFGQGVAKDEAIRGCGELLARSINPGWVGTIGMDIDPEEVSRYDIQEGSNARIRYFRGGDLVVHVSQVDYTEETVTATVDTNARDFPMLDAIRERERNATDPAKAYQKRLNQGSLTEARATFDAESPAGHIPRFALFSNLWSVIRVPAGSYGSIVRTEITTTSPAREFSVAVFDRPITAAGLLGLVGNPLTAEENPWSDAGDELDAAGMLMSWGWYQQPAGYYPGEYADPGGETSAPLSGRMVDDASWDYVSTQAPWLWVALIASGSCYVEGRFWPGAE